MFLANLGDGKYSRVSTRLVYNFQHKLEVQTLKMLIDHMLLEACELPAKKKLNELTKALLPTPPLPRTTNLYSLIISSDLKIYYLNILSENQEANEWMKYFLQFFQTLNIWGGN